ncbi:MAG TPA: hypothetical protein VII12_17140 [Thermoanaerobaculia bacterium]
MMQNVHVELLFGRRVFDSQDKVVGRIASIHARWRGKDCFVEEYRLGPAAFLEKLGISAAVLIGWPIARQPLRVPWQQMNLSDPEKLRLRCTLEELKAMTR